MAQPQALGKPRLYMPHRLFSREHSLGQQDAPLPPHIWHQFPLHNLPAHLRCKMLTQASVSSGASHTGTAAQIQNMAPENRLGRLLRCDGLWDNLSTYPDPNGPGLILPTNPMALHTLANPGSGFNTPSFRTNTSKCY